MFLHWHILLLLYFKVSICIAMMGSCLCLQIDRPKKLIILNINGLLCYFSHFAVCHGNARMFGKNIDKKKMGVKTRVEDFVSQAFKYFYIVILSCMKLGDVLEVFPMFMLETFLELFIFIWGHEQCSKTFGQISLGSHYYLKDLKQMYYACLGLPYGKEDQTLPIDNEPTKVL